MNRVSVNPISGCWEWTGRLNSDGYGKLSIGNAEKGTHKTYRAHRFSYQTFVGMIPEGLFVCHRCDNPACVNPQHLFLGTNSDNIRDCVLKGRYCRQLGEQNKNSKLTRKKVIEVRRERAQNRTTYKTLAKKYGVSEFAIKEAIQGKTWKHIDYFPSIPDNP